MVEFLIEYGMFAAKGITLVVFVLITVGSIIMMISNAREVHAEHLQVKKLNDKYLDMSMELKSATLSKKEMKQEMKAQKQRDKAAEKEGSQRKRVYVINFKGDIHAHEVASLRQCITAILTNAKNSDEVVVLLESAGGAVHDYGLAASQLLRIVQHGVKLTISVDKVAASGGYMMACVANHIIAAPFAIIGSVGVVGQMPNFNRLLKKMDIDYEQLTAGEYKRTLTLFGENTEKGRLKAQEEIEDTHRLFKEFVQENRPSLNIEAIATGEHWYGKRALDLNLIDELSTSDDYLCKAADNADIFIVSYKHPKSFMEKLFSSPAAALLSKV